MPETAKVKVISRNRPILLRPLIILELFKFRLNAMVVFSSALGYFIGLQDFNFWILLNLVFGGFLVTGSSNGMNQIIERNSDALMDRTMMRPLPTGRLAVSEAWLVSSLSGMIGLSLLWFFVNPLTSILAALSMFIYVVLYTPLKRYSPLSVFVGAFPGAIPPMLGYVAATGRFDLMAGLLFAVQFMWQFPHFWSIAWMVHEDYSKAGFRMLPSLEGKTETSAFIILIFSFMLIPVSLTPFVFGMCSAYAALLMALSGMLFALPALRLFIRMEDLSARRLMFSSFLYLPVALLILLLDKIL